MWVVPPDLVDTILKHYNETFALPQVSEGACAAVIGKIRTDGLYVVNYKGRELVRAKVPDVTKGIVYNRPHASSQSKIQNHFFSHQMIIIKFCCSYWPMRI